jgi:hypothetical protein
MAGYSDIIGSFLTAQNQQLNNQYRLASLEEQQRQNRTRNEQFDRQFTADQQQRNFANSVTNQELGLRRNEDARAKLTTDNTERLRLRAEASQALYQLPGVGAESSIAEAYKSGALTDERLGLFLSTHGSALGLFDGPDGSPRVFHSIAPALDANGQPIQGQFVINVTNPATGTTGPVTSEGGTDPSEGLETFSGAALEALLDRVDGTARTMRGQLSRFDLQELSNRQTAVNASMPKSQLQQSLGASAMPQTTVQQSLGVPDAELPAQTGPGRRIIVEERGARAAAKADALVAEVLETQLYALEEEIAVLQEEYRNAGLSTSAAQAYTKLQDKLDTHQRVAAELSALTPNAATAANKPPGSDTSGIRTALADLRQTQSAPQTQGERVASTAQQLVGSIYGNLNNQRNEGLGMIDAGRNYRGANVSADDMGRIIYAGQKRKAYDLTGSAYDVQGLNDTAVNNMLSGDDARGTGLAQASASMTAGQNMVQDANTRIATMRNTDVTDRREREQMALSQGEKADEAYNAATKALPGEMEAIMAKYEIFNEDAQTAAQKGTTAVMGSIAGQPNAVKNAYKYLLVQPDERRAIADGTIELQRVIDDVNDGARWIESEGQFYKWLQSTSGVKFVQDFLNPDMSDPRSMDLMFLAKSSGLGVREFLVDVVSQAANQRTSSITPKQMQALTTNLVKLRQAGIKFPRNEMKAFMIEELKKG